MVIPQPAGALAAHMVAQGKLDRSEQIRPNELALVVDPGHFSIDWVAYRRGFKTDAAGSTQTAGEVIVQAAARELSTEHGAKVYAEDLERAILDGATTVAAGKKDVSYQAALEYQAERIIDANLRVIRASVRQLDDGQGLKVILITGGSAKLFEVPLTKAFPQSRIVVVKDSVMANARGFYQTALMQQGNQSAA
ncbi:MAG: hypothetical protein DDT34_01525 [Firmicutes bacterium]|nr:hypothetical protein [Bacillota bacterium]